jgi:sialate O-acetylesterase
MLLSPPFHDHAVLQRDLPTPVWGEATPGSRITVRLGAVSAQVETATDGRWLLRLPPQPAGGPYDLIVSSEGETAIVRDVLIGDVWICSGQSNAEWKLMHFDPFGHQVAGVNLPKLRLLTVSTPRRIGRQTEIDGRWTVANHASLMPFSAVGGWFGRFLQRELDVPIGIIVNAWAGTRLQAWCSREALMLDPSGREEIADDDAAAYTARPETGKTYPTLDAWAQAEGPRDAGNHGLATGWARPDCDDRAWKIMALPGHWQRGGHPGSGVLWFRRTLEVPTAWRGRDLQLDLGPIDKHDDTYVNGDRIGGISWENPNSWCTPRSYTIPARQVGADGRVVIAVRARSHIFDGGLAGPACLMKLHPPGDEGGALPLSGDWKWRLEQDWGQIVPPPPILGSGPAMSSGADTPNAPHATFDCRLHPLIPYGIRGVIWYQGESNVQEAALYRRLLPLMIEDWRRVWGQGAFPFIQVQLANHLQAKDAPEDSAWASLRAAQAAALALPGVGMAVAIDVGEAADIHPKDKKSVGERLARWALCEVYHRAGLPSGPLLAGMQREAGGRLRLSFRYAQGLSTRDGAAVRHLAIADAKRCWRWAQSRIEGESLVVWHPDLSCPAAVRYAWADNPEGCNLVNGAGLPASPFDSDDL